MPERQRPRPKIRPTTRAKLLRFIDASPSVQPKTWRATKTVTNAVAMKTPVAANERGESRARPQTPWPLVQPEPSRAPKPTSRPEATRTGQFAAKTGAAAPHKPRAIGAERTSPTISDQRHGASASRISSAPPTIARRAHDAAGAEDQQRRRRPISAPPASAENGVKCVQSIVITNSFCP